MPTSVALSSAPMNPVRSARPMPSMPTSTIASGGALLTELIDLGGGLSGHVELLAVDLDLDPLTVLALGLGWILWRRRAGHLVEYVQHGH